MEPNRPGLDMNITGSPLQRGEDRGIDQADDRAVAFAREPIDGNGFVAALILVTRSSAKPSLACSSTRFDCSVFLRISVIWPSVETLVMTRC